MQRILSIIITISCIIPCMFAESFIDTIRLDHPRLFVNENILKNVIATAKGARSDTYQQVKDTAKRALNRKDMKFLVYECMLPYFMLVYWVEEDEAYKDAALNVLRNGIPYLEESYKKKQAVSWFSFARISLLMGYDWLYDELSPSERKSLGHIFINNITSLNEPKNSQNIKGENYFGFPHGGFYSVRNLKWYTGLTFYQEGIDDELCKQWIQDGWEDHKQMAAYRAKSAGDDGGMSAVTLGYVMGAYPRAEWNLIHTYRSAIGGNIADNYIYLADITSWLTWLTIKDQGSLFTFGMGDAHHNTNRLNFSNLHLAQMQYFYSNSSAEHAKAAAYLREINPKKDYNGFHFEPIYAFLLDWSTLSSSEPLIPDNSWPLARHFENLGHTFFRTEHNENSAYALFNAGHNGAAHTHADEGHFGIYYKGFQALDTGTRDQKSGAIGKKHIAEYYNRTIAHNCVLVHMPGEKFSHHWGVNITGNDGGQNRKAGKLKAFSTGQHYAYSHVDLSSAYSNEKCSYIDRQFFFLPPHHFVVIDRVRSTHAEYPKTWLLHTQEKPSINEKTMISSHDRGVMFTKTLYPIDAKLNLIGGPGKEFLIGDTNFPIGKKYFKDNPQDYLVGNWRLEVSPGSARKEDMFVHVLQVGDKDKLKVMNFANLTEKEDQLILNIALNDHRSVELRVSKTKPGSGSIHITDRKNTLISETLSTNIQAQSGVRGGSRSQ